MKPKTYQSDKKTAFTIIELLTVMSIIVILIGLLVPSLNMVKRYAKEVRQRAQFHSIDSALELFNGEWGSYPPSSAMDTATSHAHYCGAMKLCEAMVGQDLMGFHPNSRFLEDATDGTSATNYIYATPTNGYEPDTANLRARKTYLQQTTDAYRMKHLYSAVGSFNQDSYVLCDVYNRVKHRDTGKGIGMPILYYRANTLNTIHDPCTSGVAIPPAWDNDNGYIYNYWDNKELVDLGLPPTGVPADHPLSDGAKFYEITKDKRIEIKTGRPYRPDSYILISAGFDSIYGTDDDIFNFDKIAGR
jgi:type II secretory pathway pseudopilin PulG